jgi:putative DNA primase/helicase
MDSNGVCATPSQLQAQAMKLASQLAGGASASEITDRLVRQGHQPHEADQIVAAAKDIDTRIGQHLQQAQDEKPAETSDDAGNGKRLVKRHGHEIRYIAESRSWLAWNGSLWAPGATGAVERHAQDTAQGIYDDAKHARAANKTEADKLAKWASASCNRSRLEAMIYVARSHPKVEATWEQFDSNLWALNVRNGIVDLRTGSLRPHDPDEMHSKLAGAGLTEGRSDSWGTFLQEVLPDPDVRHYVHKLAGYSITGEVGEHVLPFAYGGGANGKSVFLSVLRKVLGDYACEAAPDLLVARYERGIPVDIIDLRGYRFVTTSEIEGGRKMATDVMKRITGDDELKARKMRQNFESFRNVTHLWMAANDKPQVDGLDESIWRRIRMLPFTVTIPPEQRDPRLIEKLLQERDGILGWLVDGCLKYQAEGLQAPAGVEAATDEYRNESNPLAAWAEDRCTLEPEASTSSDALHANYVEWIRLDKYRGKPISSKQAKWGAGLKNLDCKSVRIGPKDERAAAWSGIRLNSAAAEGIAL